MNALPIEKLGKFTFKNLTDSLNKIKKINNIIECIIVQKCNCVEIYAVTPTLVNAEKVLLKFWTRNAIGFDFQYINKISVIKGEEVFIHLLKTGCGLKSLLIGDAQVLGQIRSARKVALNTDTVGPILNELFNHVRIADKRVRNETNFHRGYVSIGRATTDIIDDEGNKDLHVGIIGTGEMGALIAKSLKEKNYTKVTLCNRTYNVAKKIAENCGFNIEKYENQKKLLKTMDIIVYATSSPKYLINKKDSRIILERKKPVTLIDVGNPPNVDTSISKLNNVNFVNLDFIKKQSKEILETRIKEMPKVEKIINEELKNIVSEIEKSFINRKISENIQKFNLNLRNNKNKSIFILKSHILSYIREFLFSKGFIEVHTPTITTIPTDPVKDPKAELFSVDWYGKRSFLRQSVQLHKQILIINGLKRIFEIGPFWRAEKNLTKRHLSESLGLDVEMSGIVSHHQIMDLLEELIVYVIKKLKYKDKNLILKLNVKLKVPRRPFFIITYSGAIKILNVHGVKIKYGEDIGVEREMKLYMILNKNRKMDFFFVEKYPDVVKKFYVKPTEGNLTKTFDLNFKGWELVSGAVRETEYKKIVNRMKKNRLPIKKYKFYLSVFKQSKVPPHGGFGMGLERFVAKLLDLDDVRQVVFFPRTKDCLAP